MTDTLAQQIIDFVMKNEHAINQVAFGDLNIAFENCTMVKADFVQHVRMRNKDTPGLTAPPIASHQK